MLAIIMVLIAIATTVNVAFFVLERRLGDRSGETATMQM
jgi:hypothetical protein